MQKAATFLILLLTIVGSVQAQFGEPPPPDTRVRLAHLVTDGPAVDIYLNGNIVAQGITFPQVSHYVVISAAEQYTIAVTLAGDEETEPLLVLEQQTLVPEHDTFIALVGTANEGEIKPIIVDETALKTEEAATHFLLINALPDSGNITASVDGAATTDSLPYGAYKTFSLTIPNADITININGESASAVTSATRLVPGALGLIVVTGDEAELETIFTFQSDLGGFISAMAPQLIPSLMFSGFPGLLVPQDEPITFFMPDMIAVESLPADALQGGSGHSAFFFLHHTLEGVSNLDELVGEKGVLTMHGAELTIAEDGDMLVLNDTLSISPDAIPVQFGNVDAYLVDSVLLPPQAALDVLNDGEISIGDSVSGELLERTRVRYMLEVPGNTPINIYLSDQERELDTYLRLYDMQGQVVVENDDFNGPNSAIERWVVEEDGQFIVEVGSFSDSGSGEYTLEIITP